MIETGTLPWEQYRKTRTKLEEQKNREVIRKKDYETDIYNILDKLLHIYCTQFE